MNNRESIDTLQRRAAEQRGKIHQSVEEFKQLKSSVTENVRETLDPRRQAREHFWAIAGIASLLGLVIGHGLAGLVVD